MPRNAAGTLATLALAAGLYATQPAAAQTSDLYLTDYDSPTTWVVRGGQIVRQFDRSAVSGEDTGCTVGTTLRCVGTFPGNTGREYALTGTPLAATYPNADWDSLYDGASDGTRNWSIAHNDTASGNALVEGNANWQGLQVRFVPGRQSSGVTWDARTASLWITNNSGGSDQVQRVDLAGNVLFEFPAVHDGGGYAIAWDPADDTLWVPGAFSTAGSLFQYSKGGTLLQTVTVAGLGNVVGAEFGSGAAVEAVVPTLGGAALAGFTLLMALAGAYAARGALRA
jgi:hypothetical protein